MVRIGRNAGRRTIAVLSDMDQPLGHAVGNALEVKEAIDTLKGHGPSDFQELCLVLGTQMLLAGGRTQDPEEAEEMLRESIENGDALRKLAQFVESQGGDARAVYDPGLLPAAPIRQTLAAPVSGYISHIACDEIGICSLLLGGGRETKDSSIDLSVGLVLQKKVGDYVEAGEPIAVIHARDARGAALAGERFLKACVTSSQAPGKRPLIKEILTEG